MYRDVTKFVIIKINYDMRANLPSFRKFSQVPTRAEYQAHLNKFKMGLGGASFHECLNFDLSNHSNVLFYLPPTCMPANKDEEFVIFSATSKSDGSQPHRCA